MNKSGFRRAEVREKTGIKAKRLTGITPIGILAAKQDEDKGARSYGLAYDRIWQGVTDCFVEHDLACFSKLPNLVGESH